MSRRGLAGIALLVLGGTGCDSFFEVCGTVTRCSSGEPIVGVRARVTLTDGVSDAEEATAYTAPDGTFCVALNEPPTVAATLTLDKPTYVSVEDSFEDAPSTSRDYCLEPAPPLQ